MEKGRNRQTGEQQPKLTPKKKVCVVLSTVHVPARIVLHRACPVGEKCVIFDRIVLFDWLSSCVYVISGAV